jgi:hypothetical protein
MTAQCQINQIFPESYKRRTPCLIGMLSRLTRRGIDNGEEFWERPRATDAISETPWMYPAITMGCSRRIRATRPSVTIFERVHQRIWTKIFCGSSWQSGRPDCDSVYELCTSDGFSGPTRHFRPLKRLQLTHSAIVVFIVVRIHAGEPSCTFNYDCHFGRTENCERPKSRTGLEQHSHNNCARRQ